MSSDKIFFSKEQQIFLMEMLEISDAKEAVEKFAEILVEEKVEVNLLKAYLVKIMKRAEEKL